jgi:phenylacetate-CoA ligase
MMPSLLRRYPKAEKLARQLVALYPLSARLGPLFWQWYAFLQESETWPVERLREFQFFQLRILLKRLASTSPFYQQRLADVRIESITNLASFQQAVPTLSRLEFASQFQNILCRDFARRSVRTSSTTGTTGNALQFFHPRESSQREWASICHQWRRVNFDPVRSRRAEFRGLTRHGALFQEYPEQNMVRFSILHLHAAALPAMADAINSRRLRFYHGYPSAFYLLSQEILRCGLPFPQPEAILLASEMVYDFQLGQIQKAFPGARIFAHYGCAEGTVLAGWCEHRRAYHILPQYSLVETDSATGEIIGTNLYNDVNGFLRYRMTDAANGIEASPCPDCHRAYTPVITGLDGRREDFLFSRDRGWIAPAIVTYPLKKLLHIQELQFIQNDPESIIIDYVARPDGTADQIACEMTDIETGMRELVGRSTSIKLRQVANIPRGPTGKYKWITSTLDPRNGPP